MRPGLLLFVFGLLVVFAGCKSCDGSSASDAGSSPTSLLTDKQAAQVLARVGDKTITLGDYTAALEHMDQFDRLRYQSPERRKELLDEMITVELLAQEATEKGYDKDPLAQQELRAVLRDAMLAEARKGAPTPADVPESEVRAWYEAHRAEYKDPERRRVSAIVLGSEATAKEALAAAQKAATATEWGELVRSKSIDPQARANVPHDLAGDMGIASPPDDPRGDNPRIPQEVRAAAFAIDALGGVHDKVVAAGGKFYVVRLTQKIAPHERGYEEAERTIRVKLAQDKLREREDKLIVELKKDVKVEVDEAALATIRVDLASAKDAGAVPDASSTTGATPGAPSSSTTGATTGGIPDASSTTGRD
ncbi:MAG: peptidyl-prolyl cis-trans isomerase [Labilithrix sp.]|nr:peptidyl-prolyl cis-trans isomerase [Labilithrix sp.]MCW5810668.1 peptidyl-prolyl cis-trans isomerase [Labilithrix sp.]